MRDSIVLQPFWVRVRELNERVRTAPAIKLDDKMALQHRLNDLCQKAREHQKDVQQRANVVKRELLDGLTLVRDALEGDPLLPQVHEVRADLQVIRDRLNSAHGLLRRADREEVWRRWQELNQAAWERLNALWRANEQRLGSGLDEVVNLIAAGDVRSAKDRVKTFHQQASELECSHQGLRRLRSRANTLWREANERARQKHEAYLANVGKRLDSWRALRHRNALAMATITDEISRLEYQAGNASTPVAAAMLRGQVAERRRALLEVQAADRDLEQRISSAESALAEA
jgi:hypothetical protein